MNIILGIVIVWFVGSIPVALLVGRLLASKDRIVEREPAVVTLESEQSSKLAS